MYLGTFNLEKAKRRKNEHIQLLVRFILIIAVTDIIIEKAIIARIGVRTNSLFIGVMTPPTVLYDGPRLAVIS